MNKDILNPIAEQSRMWIIKALLRLMECKPYADITIAELSNEAQLARRTFYRNFTSKDEVLSLYIYSILKEYEILLSNQTELSMSTIANVFFNFWSKHSDFLKLLESNKMIPFLLQKFDECVFSIYTKFKMGVQKQFVGQEEALVYCLTFSIGGFFNILTKWIKDGMQLSPDEIAAMVKSSLLLLTDSQTFK